MGQKDKESVSIVHSVLNFLESYCGYNELRISEKREDVNLLVYGLSLTRYLANL